jgi:hypothetical protein
MQVPDKSRFQYFGIGRHWRRVTRIVEMNCATSKAIVATLAFQNHVRRFPAVDGYKSVCGKSSGIVAATYICEGKETLYSS